jgi:TonB family protein
MKRIQLLVALAALTAIPLVAQSPVVVKWVAPKYSDIAALARISASVEAKIWVAKNGKVESVEIGASSLPQVKVFHQALVESLAKWEFQPGRAGEFILDVAYHIFPPATPDKDIKPEFYPPNALVIRRKFVKIEPTSDPLPDK